MKIRTFYDKPKRKKKIENCRNIGNFRIFSFVDFINFFRNFLRIHKQARRRKRLSDSLQSVTPISQNGLPKLQFLW